MEPPGLSPESCLSLRCPRKLWVARQTVRVLLPMTDPSLASGA